MSDCPRCGLSSPPGTIWCDCGFVLDPVEAKKYPGRAPPVRRQEPSEIAVWGFGTLGFFIGGGCVGPAFQLVLLGPPLLLLDWSHGPLLTGPINGVANLTGAAIGAYLGVRLTRGR